MKLIDIIVKENIGQGFNIRLQVSLFEPFQYTSAALGNQQVSFKTDILQRSIFVWEQVTIHIFRDQSGHLPNSTKDQYF